MSYFQLELHHHYQLPEKYIAGDVPFYSLLRLRFFAFHLDVSERFPSHNSSSVRKWKNGRGRLRLDRLLMKPWRCIRACSAIPVLQQSAIGMLLATSQDYFSNATARTGPLFSAFLITGAIFSLKGYSRACEELYTFVSFWIPWIFSFDGGSFTFLASLSNNIFRGLDYM